MNIHRLRALLDVYRIPYLDWGGGQAKSIDDLLQEVNLGECYFMVDDVGMWRITERVQIHLRDCRHPERGRLIECMQILPDGRERPRRKFPSGKMRKGETPEQAMIREIQEELYLSLPDYGPLTYEGVVSQLQPVKSYPGLQTFCILHTFKAFLGDKSPPLQEEFEVTQVDKTRQVFRWESLTPE